MIQTVATWLLGIVAAVAFVAGPEAATEIAGNTLGTIGITVGSVAGGADNMIKGFQDAKTIAEKQNPGHYGGGHGHGNKPTKANGHRHTHHHQGQQS